MSPYPYKISVTASLKFKDFYNPISGHRWSEPMGAEGFVVRGGYCSPTICRNRRQAAREVWTRRRFRGVWVLVHDKT